MKEKEGFMDEGKRREKKMIKERKAKWKKRRLQNFEM